MNDLDKAQMMAPEGEFLAYINPKEAGILKALGGSGKLTSMGIPSFTEDEEDTGDVASTSYSGGDDYSSQDNEEQQARDAAAYSSGQRTNAFNDMYSGDSGQGGGQGGGNNFFQTVGDLYNRFSPVKNIGRGIGNLFDMFADLRGFNEDGSRKTQQEYEDDRQDRINQNRISNIMGRDAPFTRMTIDNLKGLYGSLDQKVPDNINSLYGTTNNMRTINDPTFGPVTQGTIYDAEEPELGILSQTPYNFRDAMREINLQPGFNARQNLSAANFIDPSKAIGSEDTRDVQSRIGDTFGFNSNYVNLAGLNQAQVDYLNKENEINKEVGNNRLSTDFNSLRFPDQKAGGFFEYKSPQEVLDTVMGLNKQSATMFGNVNPEKNVYGDINTFAQPDEITSYIDSIGAPLEDGSKDKTYSFGIPKNEKGNKYMDLARGGFIKND